MCWFIEEQVAAETDFDGVAAAVLASDVRRPCGVGVTVAVGEFESHGPQYTVRRLAAPGRSNQTVDNSGLWMRASVPRRACSSALPVAW